MDILVLNGSPRANGNTKRMVGAFCEGARGAGHQVTVIDRFDSADYPTKPPRSSPSSARLEGH